MIRYSLVAALFITWAFVSLPARAVEPVVTEGRVSAVTVYQGQALVTRELVAITMSDGGTMRLATRNR